MRRPVHADIHKDISVIVICKGDEHKGLGLTAESIFRVFWCSRRSSIIRSSPGESDNEILMLDLAKFIYPE